MRSIVKLNTRLLFQYSDWEESNKGKWTIASYLNEFYDLNAALAFSKLFFPDFVEIDGCVILGFRYDPNIFKQWKEEFGEDLSSIERYCNMYDVQDYFHINHRNDEIEVSQIDELAMVLKASWEANCKLLYPSCSYKVDIFEEYGVKRITLFKEE